MMVFCGALDRVSGSIFICDEVAVIDDVEPVTEPHEIGCPVETSISIIEGDLVDIKEIVCSVETSTSIIEGDLVDVKDTVGTVKLRQFVRCIESSIIIEGLLVVLIDDILELTEQVEREHSNSAVIGLLVDVSDTTESVEVRCKIGSPVDTSGCTIEDVLLVANDTVPVIKGISCSVETSISNLLPGVGGG